MFDGTGFGTAAGTASRGGVAPAAAPTGGYGHRITARWYVDADGVLAMKWACVPGGDERQGAEPARSGTAEAREAAAWSAPYA